MTQSRFLSRALWGLLAIFLVTFLVSAPLAAAPAVREIPIRAAGPGELITTPGTAKKAELLALDEGLAPLLLKVKLEETVTVPDWPIAPDRRAEVRLTRREIYAPDARIFSVEAERVRAVPRSRRVFLWGEAVGEADTRVLVSIDPADRMIRGFSLTQEGIHEMRPMDSRQGQGARQHLVAPPDVFLDDRAAKAVETQAKCDQEHSAVPSFLQGSLEVGSGDPDFVGAAITSLHTVTVAVETDNELLSLKFSNNTTSASNYLAELFAAMNVIYERDLKIRLLQGTTFLRPSTTADPYNQPVSASTFDKLIEFGNYWGATYGGVTRALTMMLSGKQSSNFSSSGIAWLNGLCSTSNGYSFTQVFKFSGSTAASDTLVVAHELGHNFGSPHTHCYSPPIDNCYNAEGGCYAGNRVCPAAQTINGVPNVTGTLMSYCHLSGISGCTSSKVFHPNSIALLNPKIDAKVGACIFPAAPIGPTVAAVNPKSGPTAGGTPVTITGTNFLAGATVTFGGTAASSVVVASPTLITALTPAKATGTVAVVVT
ncbi:MAG TPA: M57 family metalloprotease, partial [Thermoanaerobaculia bacterium]|nr:M57 family metalloprotease [Thermoanaerobaculia bacterium]